MIPEYKIIAEDILKLLEKVSGYTINTSEVIDILKDQYRLSEEDLMCKVVCGRQYVFNNRVIIARTYLVKQGKISLDKAKNITLID